jgi:predicted DNA-binding transcriptional regulator YafY
MSRTTRLLALVQVLRRHRLPVTAQAIAEELEVSVRTVYRDIAALVMHQVPVRGEAGVGYVLEAGLDLPPLMFTQDEIEAIVVGMRWLRARGDTMLARAADDVVAKIGAVLPASLQPLMFDSALFAPRYRPPSAPTVDETRLRDAIRRERKITIDYADQGGQNSSRTIWPFGLAIFNDGRVVMAWCELRTAFRHFRTDRILGMAISEERYPTRRAQLLRRWEEEIMAKEEAAK